MSNRRRLLVVAFAGRPPRTSLTSARRPIAKSGGGIKKKISRRGRSRDRDTIRPHYDFSQGVRGVTVAKYAAGANVVLISPDVLDVFPDGKSVWA
jgi:hypothetical protein